MKYVAGYSKDIKFSIGYDQDGGVFLHFGDTCVKIGDTVGDLRCLIKHLKVILKEIEENYVA